MSRKGGEVDLFWLLEKMKVNQLLFDEKGLEQLVFFDCFQKKEKENMYEREIFGPNFQNFVFLLQERQKATIRF